MKPKIEVVSQELILVHGLTVDYDQTPAKAIEGLPNSNPLVATIPQELWGAGRAGNVEGVTIPLYTPRRRFTTKEGRRLQAEIGYGCPAELAALKGEDVRKELWDEGIWLVVSLMENDEDLLLDSDVDRRPVYLDLNPRCLGFELGYADHDWDDFFALVGAPQVP